MSADTGTNSASYRYKSCLLQVQVLSITDTHLIKDTNPASFSYKSCELQVQGLSITGMRPVDYRYKPFQLQVQGDKQTQEGYHTGVGAVAADSRPTFLPCL